MNGTMPREIIHFSGNSVSVRKKHFSCLYNHIAIIFETTDYKWKCLKPDVVKINENYSLRRDRTWTKKYLKSENCRMRALKSAYFAIRITQEQNK